MRGVELETLGDRERGMKRSKQLASEPFETAKLRRERAFDPALDARNMPPKA